MKPKTAQVNAVADAVKELAPRIPDVSIAQFYQFGADRALAEYRRSPTTFERELRDYLGRKDA